MKPIKVSEASGAALDWMVSLITNPEWDDEGRRFNTIDYVDTGDIDDEPYSPSTDWAQGGPIIERDGIDLYCNVPTNMVHADPAWRGSWRAKYHRCGFGTEMSHGPTPLIAAMRCYVASKLGDTVDVPEELLV